MASNRSRASERSATLVAPPSPDMERQGATALAIALGVTTDQMLVDMAREVWVAMAAQAPVMACDRARKELGWTPRRDAREALRELLQGFVSGAYGATPPLRSRRGQRWATR